MHGRAEAMPLLFWEELVVAAVAEGFEWYISFGPNNFGNQGIARSGYDNE